MFCVDSPAAHATEVAAPSTAGSGFWWAEAVTAFRFIKLDRLIFQVHVVHTFDAIEILLTDPFCLFGKTTLHLSSGVGVMGRLNLSDFIASLSCV